ncbi:hypothetical protein [Marinoscillum furvescens]|uniref:Uncharacterized protein n=1 Tax=Marinoscillum furvescens DSM 4134 TaxID=1122208 RepID=A0A3D9KYN4_MARFU|nr:hypothetical protein [Marinoscillum furvescens]RED92839.1 hypothetical protein C7460_12856 [Marinoscillum furvescens DSM 4134]
MSKLKFKTKVTSEGTIVLPEHLHLEDEYVEVELKVKSVSRVKGDLNKFLEKWTGFIKEEVTDDKSAYLLNKYK